MPVNFSPLVVFDFETTGLDVKKVDPTQIAAVVYDPRSLKEIDSFNSYVKPESDPSTWSAKALEITKLTKEQILTFPEQKQVFNTFIEFLKRHQKSNRWDQRIIPCGQNIINYDIPIFQRLCEKYKYVDAEGVQNIFNRRTMLDTIHLSFYFFESNPELTSYGFDKIREYTGMSLENAHNALTDCRQTGAYLMRYLRWLRKLAETTNFKNSFSIEHQP